MFSALQEVIIKKQVGERLGMNIKGGVQGSPGNPLDKSDEGVFISKINSNGAVHRDGRLKVVHPVTLLKPYHSFLVKLKMVVM